jgi:hypothetical protein
MALRIPNVRFVTLAILLALFAAGMYAFAASNTISSSNAGDGSQAISGYSVGAIAYTLNTTDPGNLDAVGFNVSPDNGGAAPTTVKAQLNTAGPWHPCATGTGNAWSCATTSPQATSAQANNLRVIAAQ